MYNQNIWKIKTCDYKLARELSEKLNISPLIAELLLQRGISTYEEAQNFLYGDLNDLVDPFDLPGLTTAVERIQEAVRRQEKIIIYGDYDVDGICSIVVLKQCLDRLGVIADYYVPDRFNEGYGLNLKAVEDLAIKGYKLMITVDCGITSVEEAKKANSLGMDMIICDHHTPLPDLPPALAIINPKIGGPKPVVDLCGTGVVFKLCQALCPDYILDRESGWLELVALATVADVVALKGENRIFVKYGLARIPESSNIGLQALIKECNLESRRLSAWHVGFILAPRLNSAGRLYGARTSIELLLSDNTQKAHELAVLLCDINNERKAIEEIVYKEAEQQLKQGQDFKDDLILVLSGEGWHEGVIGIVASRLCEKYHKPAILISWKQELGRGSCRSLPGINIYEALAASSSHLLQFGGHRAAAGLTIQRDKFEGFCQTIKQWAQENISKELLRTHLYADAELEPGDINEALIQKLSQLEPFGEGNPCPRFIIREVGLESAALMGKKEEHFRARLGNNGVEIIAFKRSDLIKSPLDFCLHDVLFELEENEYKGKKKIQLMLVDIKNSLVLDEPGAVTESGYNLVKAFYKSIEEVRSGRPVLYIYPTYRTLTKHRLLMRSFFRQPLLREMHGYVPHSDCSKLIAEFWQSANRVFMVTTAFIKHYLKNHSLPAKLKTIFFVFPDQLLKELLTNYPDLSIYTVVTDSSSPLLIGSKNIFAEKRILLYANRKTTLQSVINQKGNYSIEAGINDIRQRKAIRRRFVQSGGVLISDGANVSIAGLDNIKVFYADAPYSIYEARMVIDQLAAGEEKEAGILFSKKDLDFNRYYLQRIYPDIDLLRGVLSYLQDAPKNPITISMEDLSASLKVYLNKDVNHLDIIPALGIMDELGLCQCKKKGSIMAIKYLGSDKPTVNVRESIYYQEGQLEKKEFNRFERLIKDIMTGE